MKKLIISVKPSHQALNEIQKRLKKAEANKKMEGHYEISFTDLRQFKRFVSNIDLLTSIQTLKPKSIYELANLLQKDVGNLNRLINFFEGLGVLELREKTIDGRTVKSPYIPYKKIEFDLAG